MKEILSENKLVANLKPGDIGDLPRINLIALDLDGTTLTCRGLGDDTKRTLEEMIKRGVEVVIATGRAYAALPKDVLKIQGIRYLVTSNGAHITEKEKGKVIYSNCICQDRIQQLHDVLKKNGFGIEVFARGIPRVSAKYFEEVKAGLHPYLSREYILKTRNPVDDIYGFLLENKEEIENINVHFEFLDQKEIMRKELESIEGVTITSSVPHNLEIGGATTSKGTAVKEVCRILGIQMKNVIAFGDNPNDLAMITAAGIGVAMGNAEPEVKEGADLITLSNDEEGVAYALRKIMNRPVNI